MKYQYNTQEEYEPNNTFWNVVSSPYPVALIFTLSFLLLMACSVSFYMFFFFYPKTSIDFLVMGDYGGFGNENQTLVAKNMGVWCSNNPCDFIVTTGDNFYPNGTSSFDDPHFKGSFEDVYSHPSLLNLTWYTVLGNHDWKGWPYTQIAYTKNQKTPRWFMPSFYYNVTHFKKGLFDKVGVNFIMMDSTPMIKQYQDTEYNQTEMATQNATVQLKWIEKTLQQNDNDNYQWKIFVQHHSLYGNREKSSVPGFFELIRDIKPLMLKYNSRFSFNGHDHNIQVFHDKNQSDHYHFLSGAGAGTKIKDSPPHPYHIYTLWEASFLYVKLFQYHMEVRVIGHYGTVTKIFKINL